MTQKTRAAIEAEINTLLAPNGVGAVTAADVQTVVTDICDSTIMPLTDTTGALTLSGVLLSNGTSVQTDTTAGHTYTLKAYDTANSTYRVFETYTAGTTPSLAIKAPTNGTIAIDGAVIGATVPAAVSSTTLSATGLTTLTGGATVGNGAAIQSDTTAGHTATLSAYYTTGTAYEAQATLTSGTTPTLAIQPSAHGKVTQFDVIDLDCVASTAALVATSNTTLAAVTGLSIALSVGTYRVRGHLFCTSVAAGGLKAALVASGGLIVGGNTRISGQNLNGATLNASTQVTTLGADFSNSAAQCTDLIFEGLLVVTTAGTVLLEAAQNTGNASSTTVLAGSITEVKRLA